VGAEGWIPFSQPVPTCSVSQQTESERRLEASASAAPDSQLIKTSMKVLLPAEVVA